MEQKGKVMGHYTGVAFNFKVKSDVPVEIHFLFDVLADVDYGEEDEVTASIQKQLPSLTTETLQDLFTALYCSSSYFSAWRAENTNPDAKIRSYKDGRFVSYGSCKFDKNNQEAIGKFLNVALPFLDVEPGEVLVRVIGEEARRERIYWYNEKTNKVEFSNDGFRYKFNYSPYEDSRHPVSLQPSDLPDEFVPPNNYYTLNPKAVDDYDKAEYPFWHETQHAIKDALRSPKTRKGLIVAITTPGSKNAANRIIGTDLTVSGFKPFSVDEQKTMVDRLKTSFQALDWDHESFDVQADIKKIQEDFNIKLTETPDGSVQPMLTPKPKYVEQIGVEPPGIPQDKSPTITPFLDTAGPVTNGPVKIGEAIEFLEPNIVYDIPKVQTVPLPDTWETLSDKLKHGFKVGEMQVISSLMPGKSTLSTMSFPKTMADLRSLPGAMVQAGRRTGKTAMMSYYFDSYMERASKIVKRFNALKAERKTTKFKKRQLRK